jgi:hypothetical protein
VKAPASTLKASAKLHATFQGVSSPAHQQSLKLPADAVKENELDNTVAVQLPAPTSLKSEVPDP